jgi:hypothetical protein
MGRKPADTARIGNITIRVTEELRARVEALRVKYYPDMPFNFFLAYLVRQGADREDYIVRYRDKMAEMEAKTAEELEKHTEKGDKTLPGSESSPLDGIKKRKVGG